MSDKTALCGRRSATVAGALWLLLAPLLSAPALLALAHPPPGRAFSGTFAFQDDYLQHQSFAEQASRGAFVFVNKFDLRRQEPFLVNVTWWAGGVLSAVLGGDLRVGFLATGLLGLLGFLAATARYLARARGEVARLGWAVALVATGGGLGWLRVWQGRPPHEVPDVGTMMFPFPQTLVTTPHAIVAAALLVASLGFFVDWRAGARRWPWILTASLLGLARPYDLAVFVAAAAAVIVAEDRRDPRRAVAQLLELAWLAPVLFYAALAFGWHPSFASFSGAQNEVPRPSVVELAFALGPAALLAVGWRAQGSSPSARAAGWSALSLGVLLLTVRLPFTLQLSNALGTLVLLRAAAVLPARALPWAAALLCPTSLYLLWQAFNPAPMWFPPADYAAAARTLRASCRAQEPVLGPVDPGLIVAGTTPCSLVIGHRVLTPDHERRVEEVRRFYDAAASSGWRRDLLRRHGVRYVMLPRGKGAWIEGSGYRPLFLRPALEVWAAPEAGS